MFSFNIKTIVYSFYSVGNSLDCSVPLAVGCNSAERSRPFPTLLIVTHQLTESIAFDIQYGHGKCVTTAETNVSSIAVGDGFLHVPKRYRYIKINPVNKPFRTTRIILLRIELMFTFPFVDNYCYNINRKCKKCCKADFNSCRQSGCFLGELDFAVCISRNPYCHKAVVYLFNFNIFSVYLCRKALAVWHAEE